MKITVRSKEEVKKRITANDIKPGIVFKFNDDVIALKLRDGKVVHLNFWDDKFILSDGSMDHKSVKILGRLDEIIVVEE